MKVSKPFYFKQFTIHQDKTAMKVGTDGVLLGAVAKVDQAQTILDIGTGTGVVSLMLAQRSTAKITAVEIDNSAFQQASANFENSHWANRLNCIHSKIQDFKPKIGFDLIVSNPPYFKSNTTNSSRSIARTEQELSLEDLISNSKRLLNLSGKIFYILPIDRQDELAVLATKYDLNLNSILEIKGNPNVKAKRIIVGLSRIRTEIQLDELIIEGLKRHDYTAEYQILLKNYLTIF